MKVKLLCAENFKAGKKENFHEYVYEKIIMGNHVPVDQDEIVMDGHSYAACIHVVPDAVLQHGLLIGIDFLDSVAVNIRRGIISVKPI